MRFLVGIPDPKEGGFLFTDADEPLRLGCYVCRLPGCGCDRALVGVYAAKGATLAQVVDRPIDVALPRQTTGRESDLCAEKGWRVACALARTRPLGTLLRVRYNWNLHDPKSLYANLAAWEIVPA